MLIQSIHGLKQFFEKKYIYLFNGYYYVAHTDTDTEIRKISKIQDTGHKSIYYIIMNYINWQ